MGKERTSDIVSWSVRQTKVLVEGSIGLNRVGCARRAVLGLYPVNVCDSLAKRGLGFEHVVRFMSSERVSWTRRGG